MRRALRISAGVLLIALVVAQAIPPERENPPVESDIGAAPEIAAVLRRACYDCHSHETVWPWYSSVAPASWLVAHDVHEARDELDFSTWGSYGTTKRVKKFREIAEVVSEGEMPLWYYTLLHPEARLTDAERRALEDWCASEIARLGR